MDGIVRSKRVIKRKGIVEKARLEVLQIERQRSLAHRRVIVGPARRAGRHWSAERAVFPLTPTLSPRGEGEGGGASKQHIAAIDDEELTRMILRSLAHDVDRD